MIKAIDLSIYADSRRYFRFFDVEIKRHKLTKEPFLRKIGINPSSYRRARTREEKIGISLLGQLSRHFNYRLINKSLIEEIENLSNDLFYDIVYKRYHDIDSYIKVLDKHLEQNYIIFPVLKLLKLYLLANNNWNNRKTMDSYLDLFNEVTLYYNFYNEDLLKIYNILKLFFSKSIPLESRSINYNDYGLSYYILASKYYETQRYIESLYYAKLAKEIFVKTENLKRLAYINITLICNYFALENYDKCYELAFNQYNSLKKIEEFNYETSISLRYYLLTLLYYKEFNKIISIMESNTIYKYRLTEIVINFIAQFSVDKTKLEESLRGYIDFKKYDDSLKSFFEELYKCLCKKENSFFEKASKYPIKVHLIKLIEKLFI